MSERNHTTPVEAKLVSDMFADDVPPGAFQLKGEGRILLMCPCGCGSLMNLPVRAESEPHPTGVSWTWDGNKEKPTLAPSIRDLSGCKFHGFLQQGVWTFCGDSGK